MMVTWLSHDCHMTVTWWSHGCHMTVTDCHMMVTWLSYGHKHIYNLYRTQSRVYWPSVNWKVQFIYHTYCMTDDCILLLLVRAGHCSSLLTALAALVSFLDPAQKFVSYSPDPPPFPTVVLLRVWEQDYGSSCQEPWAWYSVTASLTLVSCPAGYNIDLRKSTSGNNALVSCPAWYDLRKSLFAHAFTR